MARSLFLSLTLAVLFIGMVSARDWNILNQLKGTTTTTTKTTTSQTSVTSLKGPNLNGYCESWRLNVELHNIRDFTVVPQECVWFVQKYMTSSQYEDDLERAVEEAILYLGKACCGKKECDGMDAWIFDIDDTLLSTIPYHKSNGCFGGEQLNTTKFEEWQSITRAHHPILSLVSKSLRSLVASPDLEAARSLIGNPEKLLYVCLNLKKNPSWFVLSPAPKRKLIPIPSVPNFPYQHPSSSTVVSIGSEIYLIGGFVKGKRRRSRRVFLLDCKSHQWRQIPKMSVSRKEAGAVVRDGKLYVVGGCSKRYDDTENYGEVYYPNTQTWEPTEMERRFYFLKTTYRLGPTVCLVELETSSDPKEPNRPPWCITRVFKGELRCGGTHATYRVSGLEEVSSNYLLSVANPGGGRRVTVWWKTYTKECKTEIWCAEILIECLPGRKFTGTVEWSENVFTFQGCESGDQELLLHSALVTHDY